MPLLAESLAFVLFMWASQSDRVPDRLSGQCIGSLIFAADAQTFTTALAGAEDVTGVSWEPSRNGRFILRFSVVNRLRRVRDRFAVEIERDTFGGRANYRGLQCDELWAPRDAAVNDSPDRDASRTFQAISDLVPPTIWHSRIMVRRPARRIDPVPIGRVSRSPFDSKRRSHLIGHFGSSRKSR